MTRITKIALILLLLAIAATGIFFYLTRPSDEPAASTSDSKFQFFPGGGSAGGGAVTAGAPGGEAAVLSPRLLQIVKSPVIGAALAENEEKLLYYERSGGNLWRTDPEGGSAERLSNLTIVGLIRALWNANGISAAVSYLDQDQARSFLAGTATSSAAFLPRETTSFAWSPEGKAFYYTVVLRDGMHLTQSDSKGNNSRTLYINTLPDWKIEGAGPGAVALATRPSFLAPSLTILVSPAGRAADFVEGRGISILPNPAKPSFLVSSVDESGAPESLALYDDKGNLKARFNAATLAEKCAWNRAGTALYCAVPENAGRALPDSWYQGKILFRDRIMKITVEDGGISEVLPGSTFDAVDLFADSRERYLFFRNKRDSTLWRLELGER